MKDNKKTNKRLVQCVVTSDRMDKTRVAKIERRIKHPVVGKYIKRTTKIFFHDEKNSTHIGDNVVVQETKPMSKNKSFVLISAK
jgi:small subunit ribosomal protein S17